MAKLLSHTDRAREVFGHPVKVKRQISAAGLEFTRGLFFPMQLVVVVVTDAYATWQQVLQDYPLQTSL